MIHIKHLSKSFNGLDVLSDINTQIAKGEIHGLLGVSGVGKSTLLRCINGLEAYDSGELIVNGVELKSLSKSGLLSFRKNIGMIFQNFALLERKTVYDNIALPMECWHLSKREVRNRVLELLERVGIAEKEHSYPRELSGGQKQRVAIARALSLRPGILLCDEATSALDPVTTKSVLELLREINRELGITMVVVTHEMEVAREICDHISILQNGKIVVSDTAENIFLQEPEALYQLTGKPRYYLRGGMGIKIALSSKQLDDPILRHISAELQLPYSIVEFRVDPCKDKRIGRILLEALPADAHKIQEFCIAQGYICTLVEGEAAV